jgi:hypothetical protein
MADEDIIVATGQLTRNSIFADFERALEALIVIAHGQGPNFLAYLLIMALMHAREEDQGRTELTPLGEAAFFTCHMLPNPPRLARLGGLGSCKHPRPWPL